MEKNVRVVDEQGNEYEATYPQRAKGLVKNGRARFIDEHTICLACPPDKMNDYLEENKMEENKTLTVKEVFDAINQIRADSAHLTQAFAALDSIHVGGPGDVGAAAKATAIGEIVKCRETTNQKVISFYERIYNDLVNDEMKTFETLASAIQNSFKDVSACISVSEDESKE